jgi:hypothetical protein
VLCSHFNTSRCPPRAASEHAPLKHNRGVRWPSMEYRRGGRFFSYFAHVISAVAATTAAYPRPAPASEARSRGPSCRSTSTKGLTFVHFSAQRMDPSYDTQREEAVEPRMEEGEQTQTAGWEAASGAGWRRMSCVLPSETNVSG